MFRKEFCNFNGEDDLMQERSEVGKLVTVIKNTGCAISKEKLIELA